MPDPSRMPNPRRRRLPRWVGAAIAALAAGATVTLCSSELPIALALTKADNSSQATGRPAAEAPSPLLSVLADAQWLNTPPADQSLRGKIVLVNFWTYSCINSLRPLPYLRTWAEKYRARGLVVVGVHAPEFAFEKDPRNVRRALAALRVSWPVTLDNDYRVWGAFGNRGWPGFYLIDARGRVRHYQLGEGDLAQTERWIEQLLAERNGKPVGQAATAVRGAGVEAAADWADLHSPETYIGFAKARRFASPDGLAHDQPHLYSHSAVLPLNDWDFSGKWAVRGEFAESAGPDSNLRYRFHARDLNLVLGRTAGSGVMRFRVTIDGASPGVDHGVDVNAEGWGELRDDRLYQLVRQSGAVRDRTVEITFQTAGARAYSFTFG